MNEQYNCLGDIMKKIKHFSNIEILLFTTYMIITAGISYINYFIIVGFKETNFGQTLIFLSFFLLGIGFLITRNYERNVSAVGFFFTIVLMSEIVFDGSNCVIGDQILKIVLVLLICALTRTYTVEKKESNKQVNRLTMCFTIMVSLYILCSVSYLLFVDDGTQSALNVIAALGYSSLALSSFFCLTIWFCPPKTETDIIEATKELKEDEENDIVKIIVPLALYCIIEGLVVPFLEMLTRNAALSQEDMYDCSHFSYMVAGIIIIVCIYSLFDNSNNQGLRFKYCKEEFAKTIMFIVIYLCADFLIQYSGNAIFSGLLDFESAINQQVETFINGSINWQIIDVAIVGPTVEELVFRFGLFGGIRQKHDFWTSALISSFIFGVFHFNLVIGIFAVTFGIISCIIYEKTQKIFYSILLHMMSNLISVLIVYITGGEGIPLVEAVSIHILFFSCAVMGLVLMSYRYMKTER